MNHSTPARPRAVRTVLALATSLLCATAAQAQSLSLAPAEVRQSFTPGQPLRFQLTVSNEATTAATMRASVTDLWFNEKNEKTFSAPGTSPRSAANWIEFVPRDLLVPAGGAGTLNVMVTPPPDTGPGGYYAVIFVESRPELSQAGTSTTRPIFTSLRLGALVLLTSAGTEQFGLTMTGGQLIPPEKDAPLALDFTLANTSNTHVFPQAKVAILDERRRLVARAEGEPRRFFPGQTDQMRLTWPGTLPVGRYVALLTLVYGDKQVMTREFPFNVSAPGVLVAQGR